LTQESEREGKEEKVLLNIEIEKGTNKINKRVDDIIRILLTKRIRINYHFYLQPKKN